MTAPDSARAEAAPTGIRGAWRAARHRLRYRHFGMSSVFTKTVAVDWAHSIGLERTGLARGDPACSRRPASCYPQAAYRGGGLSTPLATLTVVNPGAGHRRRHP
ncbi:hypothetical protein LT493_24420 [Streptomyces tricolor]|nr:hypothetical protein [Streptomyces tricolor]